jgi:hypothetical protein
MQLTQADPRILTLIANDGGLDDLKDLNERQKSTLFAKLGAVLLVRDAGHGGKGAIVASIAKQLNVSKAAVHCWLAAFKEHGWTGLIDGRKAQGEARASMPPITRQWIQDKILRSQRGDSVQEVHRQVIDQWNLWRRTGDPQHRIPGFTRPPRDAGKGMPAGFSYENFRRCQPTAYAASLARQGTIASYRDLPSILSTRVGTRYLETVFFDDQQYDNHIRVPGYDRPMRPLGFNALDRLTAYPFTPHIRLRWFDADTETHRHLTQREFVWYVITILCTEGYRNDDAGTRLVQEHGTAKAWSNKALATIDGYHSFGDAIASITGGKVWMDDSGLFNKAAFSELLYGPKSSGNPRFKAPIESFFHAVRTYSLPLIGQSGRNAEMAPEENYGIDQYERRVIKAVKDLPPAIQEGIASNFLTGVEFTHLAMLIYDALAARTDHKLEGWSQCGFVEPMWRWAEDEPGMWRSRADLAALPPHLRDHALHQQSQDPRLSTIINWSPTQARDAKSQDPAIKRLSFVDAVHLLPTTWAKAATVRKNHEIHITDELVPGETFIYFPEITTPRGRTEFLRQGDNVMIFFNPLMPDQVIVCDQQMAVLGTLTRNVRIGNDSAQLEAMYRQRSRLKFVVDAPVRRAMQPEADRRAAVREINDDLIARAKERDFQSPAIRTTAQAAEKGRKTAAAGRLQKHGKATDWDSATSHTAAPSGGLDDLVDDRDLPDAL